MKVFLFLFAGCLCLSSAAQEKQVFVLNPGQKIFDVLTFGDVFHYPEFKTGIVYYRDGRVGSSKMDYNLLTGEMQFLQPSGDTASLADEATIKLITIDSDKFIYNTNGKVYLQVKDTANKVFLLKKESITFSDTKKISSFGQPIIAAADQITGWSAHGQIYNLTANERTDLLKESEFYFGDENGKLFPAARRNISKMFGKYKDDIESYSKAEQISFDKEADLKKFFSYIKTLNK